MQSINILLLDRADASATQIKRIIQNMNLDKIRVFVLESDDALTSIHQFNIIILSSREETTTIPLINQLMTRHPAASLIYIPESPQIQIARYCLQQENGYFLAINNIELLVDLIHQILAKQTQAEQRITYLKEQQQVILHLATQPQIMQEDWQGTCHEVTRATADTLRVSRTGIWLYNDDNSSVICQMLYNADQQSYELDMELSSGDYPAYFKALQENRVIVANDAHNDNATYEFSGNYLDKHDIVSILDAPIRIEGHMVGVVCSEQIGTMRYWTYDDQQFVTAIADIVAQTLENRERRRAEEALRKREGYLKEAEAIAHLGSFEANLIDHSISWSDELYQIFGCEPDIQVTWDLYESLLEAEDYQRIIDAIENTIERHKPYALEHDIILEGGTVKHLYVIGRPILDESGDVIKIFGIVQDITDLKIAENQRIELELNQQKVAFLQDFIGNMTHDLKIPLSSIKSNAYLIKRVDDKAKQTEYLERLDEQVERLHKMIDDILMVSRLEYLPELPFQQSNLNDLIHEVTKRIQAKIISKNIKLTLNLSPHPLESNLARDEFLRALLNLLENAVNYTPADGQIKIRSYEDASYKIIEISDTGIGIPATDMPRIFEQFYRADNAGSFEAGTGLGLAIVKKIIDLHHGELRVKSDVDSGTSISIILP